MELEVASVSFALQAAQLPVQPPGDFRLTAGNSLKTTIGTFTVDLYELTPLSANDWAVDVWLTPYGDWAPAVDLNRMWASMHLAVGPPAHASAGSGADAAWVRGWWKHLTDCRRFWELGRPRGAAQAITYSKLRAAAAAGHELRFVFVLCPQGGAASLGRDAALRVPSPAAGSLSAEQLFGGPFSDVTVVCGGERFPAHRLALANASPVFLSMLTSGMAEGGAAEVEIREADPAALELLLRHACGAAVEVPLALAPQLCSLADRCQLRTNLAEQLTLWLSTVEVQPAALCELLPAAHALCPHACRASLYEHPSVYVSDFCALPAFCPWPLEVVVAAVRHAVEPAQGFAMAAAWMAAQARPARQRHRWPQLLEAVKWGNAALGDLKAIRQSPGAALVPGLQDRLLNASFDLFVQAGGEAGAT